MAINYFPYDYHISNTYSAASTTYIAAGQTTAGSGSLTLANTTMPDGVNHKVSLTSGGNVSGVNFTITGADIDGVIVTETIAGPSGNTVTTTNYFYTISSITVNGAVGSSTSAGYTTASTSRRIPINHRVSSFNIGLAVDLGGGTCTFDVDVTYNALDDNLPNLPATTTAPTWFTPTAWSGKSANTDGTLAQPCTAIRFRTESYTSTPTIKVHVIQNVLMS